MNGTARGFVAEFIGTFALCFFGCGAIILTSMQGGGGGTGLVTVALAHGLALAVFVTGAMYISGGQFNPAVSVALLAIGKQDAPKTAAFITAQMLGAASACGMLVAIMGSGVANSAGAMLGATQGAYTSAGKVAPAFGLESLMTFALMWAILTCCVDGRAHKLGGAAVGLTVAMCIVAFGPLTGASMNPARTFGPALYGHWHMVGWYWLAHIVGACAAAFLWKATHEERKAG